MYIFLCFSSVAIGQLALFIVLLLAVYALICVPCWLLICMDEDDFDEAIGLVIYTSRPVLLNVPKYQVYVILSPVWSASIRICIPPSYD